MVTDLAEITRRLEALENWRVHQEVASARQDEMRKYSEERFDRLEKRLDRIDGHIRNIVWIMITAVLSGFMAFALRGGLMVTGGG